MLNFQVSLELLASRVAEGHPAMVREVVLLFEAAGFEARATAEARAQLAGMARTFLAARLTEVDMQRLHEAIFEAEAEGLSAEVAEARLRLPQLVVHLVFEIIFTKVALRNFF